MTKESEERAKKRLADYGVVTSKRGSHGIVSRDSGEYDSPVHTLKDGPFRIFRKR